MLKDFLEDIGEKSSSESNTKYGKFFGLLLGIRTELHLYHLKVQSYAQHVAIGDLYDTVLDKADEIIEMCQGMHGICSIEVPACKAPSNIEAYLDKARKMIVAKKDDFEDMPEIQNILDELAGAFSKTMYKIKFLK